MIKPKLPESVKQEIAVRTKNKLDISDLIEKYSVANEDLSGAIITRFNRTGEDISNINLANAVIGTDSSETHLSRCCAKGCNLKGTKFLGKVIAKKTDFRNSTFQGCYIPYCDYRLADFRGCVFCGTVLSVVTQQSMGSKFDDRFFMDMSKNWSVKVISNEEYEKLKYYEKMFKDKEQC